MARSIFGGQLVDLAVQEDGTNDDALIVAPSTVLALYDEPGGTLQTDFLIGSDLDTPATEIVSDASGFIPKFLGPDGATILYDDGGREFLSRDALGGLTTVDSNDITDLTAVGQALLTAVNATSARNAIGAGTSSQNLPTISTAAIITGTATTASAVTAKVLADAGLGFSNYYVMPVWDGSGAHPTRPAGLPPFFVVKWRQPTAPMVDGTTYAVDGDEWLVTA